MSKLKSGERLMLDPVGQFYSSLVSPDYPGNYTIAVYFKEAIKKDILQQAVNDLFKRLPFLNGRLVECEYNYQFEILEQPPEIIIDVENAPFVDYYSKGHGHVVRVLYGDNHFKVEVTHTIIDGRSTTCFAKALLVRYFELQGVEVTKDDIVDCSAQLEYEEYEDAFVRYGDSENNVDFDEENTDEAIEAYHHEGSEPAPTNVITLNFDLNKIKQAAKKYGVTINNYVLSHIFEVIAEERDSRGSKKPIIAMMPIDCRTFFPTKTLRNFVSGIAVTMPEISTFEGKLKGLDKQFQRIDKDFIQGEINSFQMPKQYNQQYTTMEMKEYLEAHYEAESMATTATFSNIGLVKLPDEVAGFVDYMEFAISQEGRPYSFGCISVGNTLTLTATSSVEGDEILSKIKQRLECAE